MQTLSWADASNPDAPRAWQWVGAVSVPKYGKARIWQRIQGRVEGLQWVPGRFRALSVPGREKSQPAVVLEGRYARTNEQGKWNLVFGKKPIRIRSLLGDFQLPIALRGKITSVVEGMSNTAGMHYWANNQWNAVIPGTRFSAQRIQWTKNFNDSQGDRSVWVEFDKSYNLILGNELVQSGSVIRVLRIDLHGNPGAAQAIPASQGFSYKVSVN